MVRAWVHSRPVRKRALWVLATVVWALQCDPNSDDVVVADAGVLDAGTRDAGRTDVGSGIDVVDSGSPPDTGAPMDAVTPVDRGSVTVDQPAVDTGRDTGPVDVGTLPTGPDTIAFTGSLPTGTGRLTGSLTVGNRVRPLLVDRPANAGASAPLVVLFHGTNDTSEEVMRNGGSSSFAAANGVIVIAPRAGNQTVADWDHPDQEGVWWSTYPSTSPLTNPDLLLVRAILVAAARDYGTDARRVYFVGHSNGAFFAQLASMQLHERVAAWASSSGGLCNCRVRPDCMFFGRGTSCGALQSMPGWCGCVGDDKPGPINTTGRLPPAYLTHGSSDDIVSPYFTCALASRLQSAGYTVETHIRDNEQHVMPDDFLAEVWPFLSRHRIP